ncbi:MAG: 5'-methylthioadenosine/adenosylhomocysteine nucleosidase [Eubacterium sp.]|nr:5'-methylthioadenosine/adenosylhomocysteine nucleosidase [Eubacterium sp.]
MLGIIGAMDVEVDALKARLDAPVTQRFGGCDFVSGTLDGVAVTVARCSEGKVNAALCTQIMIDRYAPDGIINVGVGCSLQKDIVIKNVVVATEVCEHDMDITPLGDPLGYINGIGMVKMPTDRTLSDALYAAAVDGGITVHRGCVASGDQFIASPEKKEWLNATFGAVCGEMEGGAIGHVCTANGVPFAVLRSVSDGGDDDAAMDFPTFKTVAAAVSTDIITRFLRAQK